VIKLLLLLFPMTVFAGEYAIPEDLKKAPAFVGVCNDPACNYKSPRLSFTNATYMVNKSYGLEYALLIALGIGIGDQLLRDKFDLSDAAGIAASKFLYVRYEF
jgi:hypothetical protein